jgi:hypothetical protein
MCDHKCILGLRRSAANRSQAYNALKLRRQCHRATYRTMSMPLPANVAPGTVGDEFVTHTAERHRLQ